MFIELAEHLRCPQDHQDAFCVVVPEEMAGRMVTRGIVGCPVCRREYPIRDGVTDFSLDDGASADAAVPARPLPDADVVTALLGLTTPGGYVVLVGTAGRLAAELARRMGGVHFVGVNVPREIGSSPVLSLLRHAAKIPLRSSMARGAVLGYDATADPWVGEAARVLLNGLRLVGMGETLTVSGVTRLAVGNGLWLGEKR